jgi:hypothetical protein
MEEKEVFEITSNIVANFIDDADKFVKQQTIDHIMQNGKYYDVINISKSRVKEIVENGLKYEQLKKENAYLKSAQNKIAIEKLEKVRENLAFNGCDYCVWCIDSEIKELKGEKDE